MRKLAISILLACAFAGGCAAPQPYVNASRLERGLVIVLPGVEGRSSLNEAICRGLAEGGVDWAIALHDWTSCLGPLYNLRAEARNRGQAAKVADMVVRYSHSYPGRPIVLVGQSGGAAVAVWAAETMPYGYGVDGVILLAASLSPQYSLEGAIKNSELGIISFHSDRDWVLLGLGTSIVGTMDGRHTASAGKEGFEVPQPAGRVYDRLFQIGWQPEMAEVGHTGLHLTSGAERFVTRYVAPLVLAAEWDEQAISAVLSGEAPPRLRVPLSKDWWRQQPAAAHDPP